MPLLYVPAAVLGIGRALIVAGRLTVVDVSLVLERIEWAAYLYLAVCLLGGLFIMVRALTRLRSVTARRQLRWIVWGSSVGAVPFVMLYVVPLLFDRVPTYGSYTAVLLGCIPLAFASAIVRYRLMDVEVIIKKGMVAAAVVFVLALIYGGTLWLAGLILGAGNQSSSFWALFATLIVALIAPWLRGAIQAALDRLYYRDRYDYRAGARGVRARVEQRPQSRPAEQAPRRARARDAGRRPDGALPAVEHDRASPVRAGGVSRLLQLAAA